jgi:hypothetical protein
MIGLKVNEGAAFCRSWWQMAASLVSCHWKFIASQYEAGLKWTEIMLRVPVHQGAAETSRESMHDFRKLEHRAAERVRQGLAT